MRVANTSTVIGCVELARKYIGKVEYDWYHENSRPPDIVNCYTFVQWVFSQYGILLPQDLLGQLRSGTIVKPPHKGGDIIFTRGLWEGRIGHNGIITESETVIHASQEAHTVVEDSLADFLRRRKLKCVARIIAGPP